MILRPKPEWIRRDNGELSIQPASVDLHIARVFEFTGNFGKLPTKLTDEHFSEYITTEYFHLRPGRAYQAIAEEYVTLPEGVSAFVIHRSTMWRQGILILSSFYDPGFSSYVGFGIIPFVPVLIKKGERIAQMIFYETEKGPLYDGQYQNMLVSSKEVK